MAFDPYDPCPCGSGKKFKWCCQPIHVQVSKAFEQEAGGQHEVAIKLMEGVCAEHASNPEAWGRKAQLLYQLGRPEEAEADLQRAFDINPDYPFGLYLRGRFRHAEGEFIGALQLFRRALEVYDLNAHEMRGHILSLVMDCEMKLNRPVAGRAVLEQCIKEMPADENFKKGLEQLFGPEAKLPEAARRRYEYQKLPDDATPERRAAWEAALRSAGTGKLTDAAKAFEQLTTSNEHDAAAWFNLGLTRAWLGDNADAVAALERSVQLDQEEDRAARTWALIEVLLCGHGMENQAGFVEYSATFPVRNPQAFMNLLNELQRQRRLIGLQTMEDQNVLTGVMVEKVQALSVELAGGQLARPAAYLLVVGNMFRLWNVSKERLDAAVNDIKQLDAGALGQPIEQVGPARFEDVLAEAWAFPLNASDEETAKRLMKDQFQRYWEETWIHKPLRAVNGVPPVDAAGHANLRRKLLGHIQFVADCAAVMGTDYDFDRLRRKLGLLGTPQAAAAAGPDISAMSAAELSGLSVESLSDDQLEEACQAAVKLSATELASKFGGLLLAQPPRGEKRDRYPVANQLVQLALTEGNTDAAMEWIDSGEKFDCEHNEGRRRNDYELRRGQVLVKRGDSAQAAETFQRLLERAPAELRYAGTAAEAMLSAKQGAHAIRFAEAGLKESRKQNNRDSEQYFLELSAAAQKLGA